MNPLDMAGKMVRKAIEDTYSGILSSFEYKEVKDEDTKITKKKEVLVLEKEACRLSFESRRTTSLQDGAGAMVQDIKVFLAPEKIILPGSKVVIEQNSITTAYKSSGVPSVYASHQEIALELFERWA